jgi:hypothetical protein
MSLYEHGIVSLAGSSFITLANMQGQGTRFWSSSTPSPNPANAWAVLPAWGLTNVFNKSNSHYVVCVR